jgi:hypothetical protein
MLKALLRRMEFCLKSINRFRNGPEWGRELPDGLALQHQRFSQGGNGLGGARGPIGGKGLTAHLAAIS